MLAYVAFERDGQTRSRRTIGRLSRRTKEIVALSMMALAPAAAAVAQTGGICVPESERAGREFGCFIQAREALGKLPQGPLFWHLDAYPTLTAANAAKGPRSTVVESLGKIWLFTIAGANWRPTGGEHVSEVGPLPLVEADQYAAVYMEADSSPGMASVVHRHPGAEAWYTLEGEMCVETPRGAVTQVAGGPGVVIAGGIPMQAIGTGTGIRRSLVLILQDESKPLGSPAPDWTPKGLCRSHQP
jgi:quercetin dioxygenase-like cupin family protein